MNAPAPTELLPCPFCGGEADHASLASPPFKYVVRCLDCAARVQTVGDKDDAFHYWNTRQAASVGAEVAGEAVAWRHKFQEWQTWSYSTENPNDAEQIVEPLYASPSRSEGVSKGEVLNDDARHVKSALETLCDPLLIKVDGHLVGTARAMAIIDGMREIAQRALLRLPDALAGSAAQAALMPVDPTAQSGNLTRGQQIVADYERDMIAEPCELAAAIDAHLLTAESVLRYYADTYCEGWCKSAPSHAIFDDCGGCRARLAISKGPQVPSADRGGPNG